MKYFMKNKLILKMKQFEWEITLFSAAVSTGSLEKFMTYYDYYFKLFLK